MSYASNNGNCTIVGTTLTAAAVGSCIVTATKAADTQYASTTGTVGITVIQAPQTITFASATPVGFSATPITLSATATSGLTTFTFSTSSANTICTVSGNQLTMTGLGTCALSAAQAGNVSYAAATANASVLINAGSQTIVFGGLSNRIIGSGSFTLAATGGASGNPVVFASSTATICSVTGNMVNLLLVGTCNITANQAGSALYNAATLANRSFVISTVTLPPSLIVQTINFGPIASRGVGSSFIASATGGASGNAVTFTAAPVAVCSSSGINGSIITLSAAGVCTVTGDQAGDATYSAAASVPQAFTVIAGLPNALANLACVAGAASAVCTFTAVDTNAGPVISSYVLSCTSNGTTTTASGASSPLTVAGLKVARAAVCTVVAINSIGTGPASNAVTVMPYSLVANRGGIDPTGEGFGKLLIRILAGNNAGQFLLGNFDISTNKLSFMDFNGPPANQRFLGIGDFSGRHKSDLLFQDMDTGLVKFWSGFDGFVDSQREVRTVKPGWAVEGVADLDGDGKSDIIWRFTSTPANPSPNPDDNGVVFAWYMNDASISQVKHRGGAPVSWNLIGAADLHGNGRADMIWVSPTNQIRSLTAQPNREFVNELIGTVPAGYVVNRLGDFDGDGKADILFRNAQGKLKLWSMNGITIANQIDLPDSDPTWELYAIADLNGDGTMDVIFRKPDNTLVVWLMNAAAPQAPTVIDNAGVVPAGFLNIDP